ncbi:MAG: S49 family peptidase [Bacteroidetes bacterium]|nr:S49 family peptidase [Bacteroidota bacterium]
MNPFLLDILTSTWLLHASNPDAYGAMLVSLLRGDRISAEDFSAAREKNRPFVVLPSNGPQGATQPLNAANLSKGSVAVIPIRGIIMKDDVECGPRGSVSITQDIQSADANPNIKSILLVISSPGGTTSYTDLLSDAVTNCSKPVVAYVEGMAASAAYWIISGADKIICSSDLDIVGSIGTMLEYMDMKPYFEKAGVVIHEVYATLSTEKNQMLADLRAGNYEPLRKELLDRINSKFHTTVMANRPSLSVTTLTGKTYFASDAIALGLIDEIGSYEYALQQADSIVSANANLQINNEMKSIKMLAVWTALASFFGFTESIESKDLTEEMVGQVNDKLADLTAENTNFKTEIATATEKLEKMTADHTALQSVHAETVRQFDAFKALDAATETTTGKPGDKSAEEILSDSYSYNRIADQNS